MRATRRERYSPHSGCKTTGLFHFVLQCINGGYFVLS